MPRRDLPIVLLMLMGASNASAETPSAFGISMGEPVSALTIVKPGRSKASYLVKPTTPNAEFEAYMVFTSKKQGVCKVVGIGRDHASDRFGADTQSAFKSLRTALAGKYGNSKDFDFIKSGAKWTKPGEWAMAIQQNERTLSSFWEKDQKSKIPVGLTVMLQAKSTSPDTSHVLLSYEFPNFKACSAENDAANAAGL